MTSVGTCERDANILDAGVNAGVTFYPTGRNLGQGECDRSFGIGGVSPEPIHNFRDDAPKQSRLVFVDINRSGFARSFLYLPFHS